MDGMQGREEEGGEGGWEQVFTRRPPPCGGGGGSVGMRGGLPAGMLARQWRWRQRILSVSAADAAETAATTSIGMPVYF